MTDVEVRTELTLDDQASRVMDRIEQGFTDLQDEVSESKSKVSDFGTQFTATFAALNIVPIIKQMGGLAASVITVGSAVFDVEQGLAGLIAGMTGTDWKTARSNAEGINDEFNELSINVGQAKDDIIAGHRALITFLGGTEQAFGVANKNMTALTTIANVQGLAVQDLGMQFGKMAAGFVSVESPVFNLLRSTGIFAADVKNINAEWQKLTQEERINRLEGAFQSVADNLSEAPPTLSDMVTSIRAIGDEFLETFGKSAMTEFMGGLGELRGDLQDARGDMRAFARDLGRDLGRFVGDAIEKLRDGFQYIRTHSDEIRTAIKEGFMFARETIKWILAHKEKLVMIGAGMYGSGTGIGGVAIKGASNLVGAAARQSAAGITDSQASTAGAAAMGMSPAFAGSVAALGSFAAAVTGAALALDQFSSIYSETGGLKGDAEMSFEAMQKTLRNMVETPNFDVWTSEQHAHFTRMRKNFVDLAQELGRDAEAAGEFADKAFEAHMSSRRLVEGYEKAAAAAEFQIKQQNMLDDRMSKLRTAGLVDESVLTEYENRAGMIQESMTFQINALSSGFEALANSGNRGAAQYIANMLVNSKNLQTAFLQSSNMTSKAYDMLAEMTKGKAEEFSEQVSKMGDAKRQIVSDAKKAKPQFNMNGGQVFKIQQNFREQDPDRIAVAFEKKFTQAAVSRVQATTSTPFGT